jgi:membrane protein YdbS with pleckstrin-like domain
MRAAAFSSASLVAMGVYIALAAPFAFSPLWIGIGLLTIAVVTAVVYLVFTPARPASRQSTAAAVLRTAD